MSATVRKYMLKRQGECVHELMDTLAVERSLVIVLDGDEVGRTMYTPGREFALILGFLFTEGHIHTVRQVESLHFFEDIPGQAVAEVHLATSAPETGLAQCPPRSRTLHASLRSKNDGLRFEANRCITLMQRMEARQETFTQTGATHCAGLFSIEGQLLTFAEDIGRHNALDKAIGEALQMGALQRVAVATMSSRLSNELVNKAAAAHVSILCGISVATSLAVETASAAGITLVGRLRNNRMNIYTHPHRIVLRSAESADLSLTG